MSLFKEYIMLHVYIGELPHQHKSNIVRGLLMIVCNAYNGFEGLAIH